MAKAVRKRGRPPKRKSLWPLGVAAINLEQSNALRSKVRRVLTDYLSVASAQGDMGAERLLESLRRESRSEHAPKAIRTRSDRLQDAIIRELGNVRAAQDLRGKLKQARRGRMRRFDVQVFLARLELHLAAAGVKLVNWEWGDKARAEGMALATALLAEVTTVTPSFRQWRQRHYFQ